MEYQIDLSKKPEGIYLLRIYTENTSIFYRILLK
jgi:hypothetical protein